jgi:hypothetical protein
MRSVGTALLLSCAACGPGDLTSNFVGVYSMSGTISYDNGKTELPFSGNGVGIGNSATTQNQLLVPMDNCNVTATATTSQSFVIDNQTCPGLVYTDTGCGSCSLTLAYTTGAGSLVGKSLTISGAGNYSDVCANCGTTNGTFNLAVTGSKS